MWVCEEAIELLRLLSGPAGFERILTVAMATDILIEVRKYIRLGDLELRDVALEREQLQEVLRRLNHLVWSGHLVSDKYKDEPFCTSVFLKFAGKGHLYFFKQQACMVGSLGNAAQLKLVWRALDRARNLTQVIEARLSKDHSARTDSLFGPLDLRCVCDRTNGSINRLATFFSVDPDELQQQYEAMYQRVLSLDQSFGDDMPTHVRTGRHMSPVARLQRLRRRWVLTTEKRGAVRWSSFMNKNREGLNGCENSRS